MSSVNLKHKKVNSQSLQNVKVVVRVRPLHRQEEEQNVKSIVTSHTHRELLLKDKKYSFDRVFKPDATQIELYMNVVAPLIQDVIVEGYNGTVFAYGQTGTGKTFTMTGEKCNLVGNWREDKDAGIIPRAAFHIFHELDKLSNIDMNIKVSYIELYNEEIRDLLSDHESPLQMFSDNKGTVSIHGLTAASVYNGEGICKLLQKGIVKRKIAPTLMNHQSSRSHTVFTIFINIRENTVSGNDILKVGKLNLVDLAGHENIARSGCKDLRATELANINRSLLTLGRVTHALVDKSQKHVPYRDSKLTRILQDSLGGHTKTVIIATVSPAHNSYEETTSTLEYASRARDIKNIPIVNEKLTKQELIDGLRKEIDRLKKDLDAARSVTGFYVDKDNCQKMLDAITAVTGETITVDALTEMKAKRIEHLEDCMYSKVREFEENVEQCKQQQQELKLAKATIREKDDILEQEKFLAKWYENESSEKIQEAQKLLSATQTLYNEKEILLAKLEHQFNINVSNGHVAQTAVTNFVNMSERFGEEVKSREEKIKDKVKKNVLDLQTDFQHYSGAIKKQCMECKISVREKKNSLSARECISLKTKNYFAKIKRRAGKLKSVPTKYKQQLDVLMLEVPKIAEIHQKNSERFFNDEMNLLKSQSRRTCDHLDETEKSLIEQNQENESVITVLQKRITENNAALNRIQIANTKKFFNDETEKSLIEQNQENESVITILQKRITENNAALNRIQIDRKHLANTEKMSEECLVGRANNLQKLVSESLESLHKCNPLPSLIEIQNAQIHDLVNAINDFENQTDDVVSTIDKRNEEFTQHVIDDLSTSIVNYCNGMDEKVKKFLDGIDVMMKKSVAVESFTEFISSIKEALIEQILDKNLKTRHVGDTPVRQSTAYPSRIQDVAPRDVLINKFKESALYRVGEDDL